MHEPNTSTDPIHRRSHSRWFAVWRLLSGRAWATLLVLGMMLHVISPIPVAYVMLRFRIMRPPYSSIYGAVYAVPHWLEHNTSLGYHFYASHWSVLRHCFGPWSKPFFEDEEQPE